MSRVVTSADIDALNRKTQQQGQELSQTNERVARLEAQVRELQGNFKALEENLIGPDPRKGLIEVPEFAGLSAAGTPVVAQSSPPAYVGEVSVAPYGAGLQENVVAREAEKILKPEDFGESDGPGAEDGPEFEGFAERAGRDPETFLSDGGPVTDSAPASDAGVSVAGE